MVRHGGSSASSYLADPTSPIPSHCASTVVTSTVRVKKQHKYNANLACHWLELAVWLHRYGRVVGSGYQQSQLTGRKVSLVIQNIKCVEINPQKDDISNTGEIF